MKTLNKILILSAVALSLGSCSKDFLTVAPKGGTVSADQVADYAESNPSVAANMVEGQFKGLYSWMYTIYAGGLVNNHTDFGQKGVDIYFDLLSGDVSKGANNYGWYGDIIDYTISQSKAGANSNYGIWRYFYRIIFTANGIMDSLGGDEATFEPDNTVSRQAMGQLLGMRGYAYFYLIQAYSNVYDPQAKLVPIYRSLSDIDLPVATQGEVYQRVIDDLTKAIEYLDGFEPQESYRMDADVARGLLAYTYGAMGNYEQVKKLTDEIIATGKYQPFNLNDVLYPGDAFGGLFKDADGNYHLGQATEESGMGNVNLPGVMWGTDITTDMGLDLVSFWGHMDPCHYSYGAAGDPMVMNNALFAHFPKDDARRGQFDPGRLLGNLVQINKFYDKGRVLMGKRSVDADYIYMRYDEILLLNAEANAFLGNEAAAKKILKDYLSFTANGAAPRVADVSYIDALSGNALKDEIMYQERLELWGEGKALFAIRRFKATVNLGTNRYELNYRGKTMAYNDPLMHFVIPENEEINNVNLYN